MTIQFRPAVGDDKRPLVGLYGGSGVGKTYSALLLARGLVGPHGKIGMIDTESGRGKFYHDLIPGGYDTADMTEPFSPGRYMEAIDVGFHAGLDALIIDSMSHEWEGVGGVTDIAAEIEERTGKPGLHCWKDAKMQHTRMMLKILQGPIPVICCIRAKHRSRQGKDEKGRTVILKDEHATPIQAEDFISEMTVHCELLQDHTIRVTKLNHPALATAFRDGQRITVQTGEALALWAQRQPAGPPPLKFSVVLSNGKAKDFTNPREWRVACEAMLSRMPDPGTIDAWLERNRDTLREANAVNIEDAMAVVSMAHDRKIQLAAGQQ